MTTKGGDDRSEEGGHCGSLSGVFNTLRFSRLALCRGIRAYLTTRKLLKLNRVHTLLCSILVWSTSYRRTPNNILNSGWHDGLSRQSTAYTTLAMVHEDIEHGSSLE